MILNKLKIYLRSCFIKDSIWPQNTLEKSPLSTEKSNAKITLIGVGSRDDNQVEQGVFLAPHCSLFLAPLSILVTKSSFPD